MDQKSVLFGELRRYILAGSLAFCADFLTLFSLTEYAGWHYLVSATTAFTIGLIAVYFSSIMFVFKHRAMANRRHEFIIFVTIGLAGLALNNICLFVLTGIIGLHYLFSKVIVAGIVLVFNFSLRRLLLFTPQPLTIVASRHK